MRRGWWIATGVGLATIGAGALVAWLLAHEAAKLPGWPVVIFSVLTAAGTYFVIAAHAALPPASPKIEPDHARSLRTMLQAVEALSREGSERPFVSDRELREFVAHHQKLMPFVDDVVRTATAEQAASERLHDEVVASVAGRFPEAAYWNRPNIAATMLSRLHGESSEVVLAHGDIWIAEPMVEGRRVARDLSWEGVTVWWPTAASAEADATDAELQARIAELRAWFREIVGSPAAKDYRDAVLTTRSYRDRLAAAVLKVIDAEPHSKWRCPTCKAARKR